MNGSAEGDVESPLREGVQALMYGPEDMGVAVIVPGTVAIMFRGGENDLQQLAEYTRRDIAIARALLMDAMNRLDSLQQQPYPRPAVQLPPLYPGPQPW